MFAQLTVYSVYLFCWYIRGLIFFTFKIYILFISANYVQFLHKVHLHIVLSLLFFCNIHFLLCLMYIPFALCIFRVCFVCICVLLQ